MSNDLHRAETFFRAEGLNLPPLPAALADQLRERAPGIYATCELVAPPYALEVHVGELLRAAHTPDYAVLALDGHGSNSWALHYYLVSGPLALFVQLPWGGAYTDAAAARAEIERVLAWAGTLSSRLEALQQRGRLAPQQKLLVVLSRYARPGWAWVRPPEAAPQDLPWQPAQQMLGRIDAELETLGRY